MNKLLQILFSFFLTLQICIAQTDVTAGNVSGTWTKANSPYLILGEIAVPNDSTLTIEPGVEVILKGHYKFNIQGRLLAMGSKKDSIKFSAENKSVGWWGIRFRDTPRTNDTSKIVYCSFKNGNANYGDNLDRMGGAIFITEFNKVLISNCLFDSNTQDGDFFNTGGPAIGTFNGSAIITNNTFTNNWGPADGAICCWGTSNSIISNNIISKNRGSWGAIICGGSLENRPTISNNIISHNVASVEGGGIDVSWESNALILNNIIIHNYAQYGGGIRFIDTKSTEGPIAINNTIAFNDGDFGGGIDFADNSDPILINNIIFGNSSKFSGNQVNISNYDADPHFFFNDVQGGTAAFGGLGAGSNYSGLYQNNIDLDPLFNDALSSDYSLSNLSPCIGAGIDSIEINGTWFYCPMTDIEGDPRPYPTASMPDLGAYESNILVNIKDYNKFLPTQYILYQNYPNPFNPRTNISFSLPIAGNVSLTIYDALGNKVLVLVNESKSIGNYTYSFDGSDLSSAIYFFRLETTNFVETKKMLLIK